MKLNYIISDLRLRRQRLIGNPLEVVFRCEKRCYAQSKAELLWYSQTAFKITMPGGKVIMIDPWIMAPPRSRRN